MSLQRELLIFLLLFAVSRADISLTAGSKSNSIGEDGYHYPKPIIPFPPPPTRVPTPPPTTYLPPVTTTRLVF